MVREPARQLDYASVGRRLLAMTYEALLVVAVLAVTMILPHVLIGAFSGRVASPALLWAHLFAVLLVYFLWFWCRGGQTLAMKTWRIRLVGEAGRPVRPAQALLRYLVCWLSVGACGAGIIWALVDRDRQFLHDRLAGTRLIRT
ncbi:MAG: RDD family protein [Propionivibrio sp.]